MRINNRNWVMNILFVTRSAIIGAANTERRQVAIANSCRAEVIGAPLPGVPAHSVDIFLRAQKNLPD
jgi:hypothetical protein